MSSKKVLFVALTLLLVVSIIGNVYQYNKGPVTVEKINDICNQVMPSSGIGSSSVSSDRIDSSVSIREIEEKKNAIESEQDPEKKKKLLEEFKNSLPQE